MTTLLGRLLLALASLALLACGDAGTTDRTKAQLRLLNASVGYAALDLREANAVRQADVPYGGSASYAQVDPNPDGLSVHGLWADAVPPGEPVTIDPHHDHRIAMAMARVGLRRPGLAIRDPHAVAKSWPGFWRELAGWLGERVAERAP